tara:strand:+ start:1089 stop:1535 length:447 start_codon:yes stop_codon:yes gene_type:complete
MLTRIILSIILILKINVLSADNEYFLTLRNDVVNLRQGPSFDYPVKIIYKKKYLPVIIKDKSENFRKIIDHEKNSGWIHVSQLSKKKAGIINIDISIMFDRPTIYSKPIAKLEKGRLCLIKKCVNNWCKIKVKNYIGWIKKDDIWGRM